MVAMATPSAAYLTPEEYLAIERQAEYRSEYIDGVMYAMSGASYRHVRIVGDISGDLNTQLDDSPCEALSNDMRVQSASRRFFTYPDIVVACRAEGSEEPQDTLTDARLIVEVLSPSTKNYDRGEKFEYYRALPSFREYLVVHQDRVLIEHHVRRADGSWLFHEHADLNASIRLESIGCSLGLARVYRRLQLAE